MLYESQKFVVQIIVINVDLEFLCRLKNLQNIEQVLLSN